MDRYLYLLENKVVKVAAVMVGFAFIYKAGHAIGEFIYYVSH